MSRECFLPTTAKDSSQTSGRMPCLTLSSLTKANIFFSFSKSAVISFWVNWRSIDPFSSGLTVKKVNPCLVMGPKISFSGLSKMVTFLTKRAPSFESKISFLMSGFIGSDTVNNNAKAKKSRAFRTAGIKPRYLLIAKSDKWLTIFLKKLVNIPKKILSTTSQTDKNPIALAAIWLLVESIFFGIFTNFFKKIGEYTKEDTFD